MHAFWSLTADTYLWRLIRTANCQMALCAFFRYCLTQSLLRWTLICRSHSTHPLCSATWLFLLAYTGTARLGLALPSWRPTLYPKVQTLASSFRSSPGTSKRPVNLPLPTISSFTTNLATVLVSCVFFFSERVFCRLLSRPWLNALVFFTLAISS